MKSSCDFGLSSWSLRTVREADEEEQYLLEEERTQDREEEHATTKKSSVVIVGVALVIAGTILLVSLLIVVNTIDKNSGRAPAVQETNKETVNAAESFITSYISPPTPISKVVLTISNEYGGNLTSNMMLYPFLKDAYLMEPFRESTVGVTGVDTSDPTCKVWWAMKQDNKEGGALSYDGELLFGNVFMVTPEATGPYTLSIKRVCETGKSGIWSRPQYSASAVLSYEFTIWVKYVRRELMSLTEQDREEFLDAFHTLWRVNTIQGQKIYGENYKSLYYFAMIHNDAAGNGVCDEFHGGLGFVNNHVYLSSFLEQSLQLVNPRVALHYMDYSKYFESDAFQQDHLSNTMDGGRWTEIMTHKWFGSSDPISGRILDGRWVDSPVPMVDANFYHTQGIDENQLFFPAEADRWLTTQSAHMHSPNGLLRARWSLHPGNYTIRYNNVDRFSNAQSLTNRAYDKYRGVRCEQYTDFLTKYVIGKPFEVLLDNMEGGVHGPIHFTFGGAGGEKYYESDLEFKKRFGLKDNDLAFITQLSHTYMKQEAPRWWITDKVTRRISWNCTFPFSLLSLPSEQGILGMNNWPGEPGNTYCDANSYYYQNDDTLNEFIDMFFAPLSVSSKITSAKFRAMSVADKTDAVRLLNTRYQFDGDMATSAAAIDPLFWVQHGAVERLFQRILFADVLTDKTFTKLDKCSGHSADGVKYWLTGFKFEDKTIKPELLTNAQLTDILDPTGTYYRDYLNFVYDTASFSFCNGLDAMF